MVKELIWVVFVNVSQYKFEDLWNIAVAPFMGAWIEIWVSQAEFARSRIVFDFEDSSVQAEAAKKMEKYVQDNSFKGISQTTNILETRYIPNTPPVSEEPADDRS